MGKRKPSVIRDELNFNSNLGGLYAIYPFDNVDTNGMGLFKVGMAKETLNNRLDHFFNYFPEQFRIVCLMEFLRYPVFTNDEKANYTTVRMYKGEEKVSYVKFLLAKEKELHDYLIEKGSTRIYSDGRVRNPQFATNEEGKKEKVNNRGSTEWFYTKEEWIKQWFITEDRKLNRRLPITEKVSHIFIRDNEDAIEKLKPTEPDDTKFTGELTIGLENKEFTAQQLEEERRKQEEKKEERKKREKERREKKKAEQQRAAEQHEDKENQPPSEKPQPKNRFWWF